MTLPAPHSFKDVPTVDAGSKTAHRARTEQHNTADDLGKIETQKREEVDQKHKQTVEEPRPAGASAVLVSINNTTSPKLSPE